MNLILVSKKTLFFSNPTIRQVRPSLVYLGLMMLMGLIVSCDRKKPVEKTTLAAVVASKVSEGKLPAFTVKETRKALIHAPDGFQLVNLNTTRTSAIGTVEKPTINGGVLNASDGLPISQEQSASIARFNKNEMVHQENKSFEDSWAKAKEVKAVLSRAVREGKINYVMNEAAKRGLPSSVAIIPIVESKYDDSAVSPKGASGSWQIMPSLANDYHLDNNDLFDFKKSTQVALDHIKKLHNQFGNWELTFAAYNAGSKRVADALQANYHAKSIEELRLPIETKNYVKRIKAINQQLRSM